MSRSIAVQRCEEFVQECGCPALLFRTGMSAYPIGIPRTDLSGYSNQAFADIANSNSYALGSIGILTAKGFVKKQFVLRVFHGQ